VSFFQSVNPNRPPISLSRQSELIILRERVLQYLCLSTLISSIPIVALSFILSSSSQQWLILSFGSISFILLLIITLNRNIRLGIRTILFLLIIYLIGVFLLIQPTLSSQGRTILFASAILATALGGFRAGILASLIGIISIIVEGVIVNIQLSQTGVISPADTMDWIMATLIFGVSIVAVGLSVQTILNSLEESSEKRKNLSEELAQKQKGLEEELSTSAQELSLRDKQMMVVNQIVRIISRSNNMQELLNGILTQINSLFDFYHTGIFLLDPRQEYAELKASTSEAGRFLMEQNHRLRVGEVGMVGFVVSKGELRIAQNVINEPLHFKNPMLPETKAEITLPLMINQQVIGAMDVQSTEEDAFSQDDIKLLVSISEQLSYAVDRIRVLEKLQFEYSQMESGYRQLTQTAWANFFKTSQKVFSYRFKDNAILPNVEPNPEAKKYLASSSSDTTDADSAPEENITSLAVPLLLRNQPLGVLNLRFNAAKISKEQINLLETTASRLALALENARLLEEVQSRAAREHLVSDISAKVRASTDIEQILRTTAAEIGKSLNVSEVLVQLRSPD
jgi:GAF domain-containing protein